eukprot:m.12301 g.12301  ORF g.12301 m.12301 type:complete len:222 (+) comp7155_c0_seq2:97-762(+)
MDASNNNTNANKNESNDETSLRGAGDDSSDVFWKRKQFPFAVMSVIGVVGFALTFRRGYNTSRALAEAELNAANAMHESLSTTNSSVTSHIPHSSSSSSFFKNLPSDGHALARRALLYATGLVSMFGVISVGVTSLLLDVQSVPEFNDKVRPRVQRLGDVFRGGVQFTADKVLPPRKRTTKEEEEEGWELINNIREGNVDLVEDILAKQHQQQHGQNEDNK